MGIRASDGVSSHSHQRQTRLIQDTNKGPEISPMGFGHGWCMYGTRGLHARRQRCRVPPSRQLAARRPQRRQHGAVGRDTGNGGEGDARRTPVAGNRSGPRVACDGGCGGFGGVCNVQRWKQRKCRRRRQQCRKAWKRWVVWYWPCGSTVCFTLWCSLPSYPHVHRPSGAGKSIVFG